MKVVSACYDAGKIANSAKQFRVIFGWHLFSASEPVEKRHVGDFQKRLIRIEFFVSKARQIGVSESAKHEIHLANAAPPGPHEITASARVEICAGARCSGHLATFPGDSAHIARQIHDVSLGEAFPLPSGKGRLHPCDQRSSILSSLRQRPWKAWSPGPPCFWPMSSLPISRRGRCVSVICSSPCPIL